MVLGLGKVQHFLVRILLDSRKLNWTLMINFLGKMKLVTCRSNKVKQCGYFVQNLTM